MGGDVPLLRGFTNFLIEGDLIVIAVGLVIALAFSTLIKAFTDSIITRSSTQRAAAARAVSAFTRKVSSWTSAPSFRRSSTSSSSWR
jgi:large-conductance mechanosensitive channel